RIARGGPGRGRALAGARAAAHRGSASERLPDPGAGRMARCRGVGHVRLDRGAHGRGTTSFGRPMSDSAVVADAMIDPTDATDRLRERFAGLAPRYIVRVAELPRTETGKLRRQALAEELQSRLAAGIAGD